VEQLKLLQRPEKTGRCLLPGENLLLSPEVEQNADIVNVEGQFALALSSITTQTHYCRRLSLHGLSPGVPYIM